MRKTILGLLLCSMLAIPSVSADKATVARPQQKDIQIRVNGNPAALSQPALTENNALVVPLAEAAEALGAKVAWGTGANRDTATIERGDRSARLTIGSVSLETDGRTVKLETAPRRSGGDVYVPLRALSEALGMIVAWDGAGRIVRVDDPAALPAIGTYKKLSELIGKANERGNLYRRGDILFTTTEGGMMESPVAESPLNVAPVAEESLTGAVPTDDYSRTNVQTEGVDEADWAKTDGRFVYQISGSRVLIADVSDPRAPKLAATLEYDATERFVPQELYVDESRLIVIGQNWISSPVPLVVEDEGPEGSAPATDRKGISILPVPEASRSAVTAKIYEIGNADAPKLVRETKLEGQYVTSRKIDDALYIVSNKGYFYPTLYETAQDYEPWYGDTGRSPELKKLPIDRIRYFPGSPDNTTMLIGALDLSKSDREMQVSAYLGSGQTIYASTKHLYAAIPEYVAKGDGFQERTKVHKFRLDGGSVVYAGEGSVPGTPLNQYSMDEHQGFFRIATTKGNMWGSGEAQSTNNLYVLDEGLKTVGKLEKLAPGERIYSVRFVGKRAYIVTFRNVDPLFAIDLRDPAKPSVLGQLKIPGYSDYLHPYDDNHIIGFGKDTEVQSSKGSETGEPMAFYQGLKMALFDVSDVARPKEKFKEIIGDRGTHSELLSNPKALLFSKSRNLLAFPVELMEIPNKASGGKQEITEYGEFVYQGAYVYRIDPNEGFKLRGRITHLSDEDFLKSGQYGYDDSKAVRRILYSGDTLFTLSASELKASDMASLAEKGKLIYPEPPADENYEEIPIVPAPIQIPRPIVR
ncbi:beta-propeller domain-containing protein [Cohnella phaseoli]|uniref:Putative secreted protein with C-terminal beta-propeller domain n=1 Tax=Cohnella phaseoli TaxID=456490 RepID=A0A3D9KFN8_9BACL|nr:beta-propeller domain-containing protein [Cohnella phaseoli]RED85269.1 putative secreted protein with C-terminal beta-propeller domain [Cohnella phaseoli]